MPRSVAELPAERLEAEIVSLAQRLAAGTYELLVLVGELDARGTWATWGALSCAAWLADACGIEVSTARSQVRVAKALRAHPVLDEAMRSGDVSYAKARTLAPHLSDDNAEELVRLAAQTPAGRLGAALAAWSQRHEDPDAIERRLHDARSMTWRTDPDGMVSITVRLPPARAAQVCALVDQQVMVGRAPAGASLRQQRADALEHLVVHDGGSVTAEVIVHVGPDGNHLPDGTPLTDHAVTNLLPDAFLSLLLHDTARHPIDASPRRRNPTRRQRRVLDARQPQCAHPGCTATALLQADHIHPYAAGGPTIIDNLQLLCGPHNRQRWNERQAGG